MKKIIPSILILLVVFSVIMCSSCNSKLYNRADDTEFVVLQFSDIHLDGTKSYERRAFRTLDNLVKIVNPDFIVFTGDITLTSKNGTADNIGCLKALAEKLESYNVPWTYSFGNHDPEGPGTTPGVATKAELSEYLETLDNCVYERGPLEVFGEGNHFYNVTDAEGKAIMTMFFMDSTSEKGPAHEFTQSQIDWYTESLKEIATEVNGNDEDYLPSIAFFHIPPREMATAYAEAVEAGTVLYGRRGEDECPADNEDQMLETMIACGSTKGIFVGHEHLNNYVVDYNGIRLTYTNTFDHKMYIPTRGGTIINVKKDGSFTQQGIYRKKLEAHFRLSEEL